MKTPTVKLILFGVANGLGMLVACRLANVVLNHFLNQTSDPRSTDYLAPTFVTFFGVQMIFIAASCLFLPDSQEEKSVVLVKHKF
jgi:hypothetical protein